MIPINKNDFEKLLNNFENQSLIIEDYAITLSESISIDISRKSYEFRNCIFNGERIDFYDFDNSNENKIDFHSLSFKDCEIENDLVIKDCKLYQVILQNVKITSRLFYITSSEIESISIAGTPNNYNLISNLLISNLQSIKPNLDIRLNVITNVLNINESQFDSVMMNMNKIKMLHIKETIFNGDTQFWRNTILNYFSIRKCTFNNLDTKESDFGNEILIENNDFLGNCNFEKTRGANKTSFKIEQCNFNKYVYFDNSELYSLKVDSSFFREIVSFQNTTFEKVKFNRTHFEKIAYFNNIQISAKNDLDLNTVRTIKTQLLKAENKIDYLEFKKYEFELYRKSLNKDKNKRGSRVILWLNKVTSDYNTNWIKGLAFTLVYGLVFYLILYLLVFGSRDLKDVIIENRFWLGYFKFLIIPNFNSPFEDNNIEKWYQYLFFIIGKIAITYGAYETIQSFRKYGKT